MRKLLVFLLVIGFILLPACAAEEIIAVTVKDVRVTNVISTTTKGGDAVEGAIIGGLAAGTLGAIAGAAIGDEGREILIQKELLACRFIVETDGGVRVAFDIKRGFNNDLETVSLLRNGDRIKIFVVDGRYYWRSNRGEILPNP